MHIQQFINAPRGVIVAAASIIVLAVGVLWWSNSGDRADTPSWRVADIERGELVFAVSASGALTAVVTVDVSSQLSGQIAELLVDYNTPVKKGQVLARLDAQTFDARVRQAQAELEIAKATLLVQQAAIRRAGAELDSSKAQTLKARSALGAAERELARKRGLIASGAATVRDIDRAQVDVDTSKAQVDSNDAGEKQAEAALVMAVAQVENALAQVRLKDAALFAAKVDLERTDIRAPIDGIVLKRNIDLGQTVAASLQAPNLFTIAEDLRAMQVEVNIDEADIGKIELAQRATFTVDAMQGRTFEGEVAQIRKAPQTVQNVVTYTVVVRTSNDDLKLLPGLTANVKIVVARRADTLKIPNAALRYRPAGAGGPPAAPAANPAQPQQGQFNAAQFIERLNEALKLSDEQRKSVQKVLTDSGARMRVLRERGATPAELQEAAQKNREQVRNEIAALLNAEQRAKYEELAAARAQQPSVREERVYVVDDGGRAKAVAIRVGIGDGSFTELVSGPLNANQKLIVGTNAKAKGQGGVRLGF